MTMSSFRKISLTLYHVLNDQKAIQPSKKVKERATTKVSLLFDLFIMRVRQSHQRTKPLKKTVISSTKRM
ncbi:hypothetical protein CYJ29_02290 [Aerococcus loyolae]|uniref:Uncharacterized protein n=1 Tax=Aerococcus urinae TaxID=1376 RepID=A0A178HJ33_9LACT|nr:hypothetical protein A1D21_04375 [Aerococcus loyolae]OFL14034.1 hypothetical protein HMPREF2784_03890 [Aerococcus loyolae]PKY87134.1 hypothetical protein CYJ30_02010 [Aerococcus loyolae]PKZ04479.1 hypothetical protein CYJ29_02290 [Aerococcus loyolae]RAV67301.1 hypothetical protein DBT51_06885 [Aerococcus loyolae]